MCLCVGGGGVVAVVVVVVVDVDVLVVVGGGVQWGVFCSFCCCCSCLFVCFRFVGLYVVLFVCCFSFCFFPHEEKQKFFIDQIISLPFIRSGFQREPTNHHKEKNNSKMFRLHLPRTGSFVG